MSNNIIDIDPDQPEPVIDRDQILRGLQDLGLRPGDRVAVHSSLSSLGRVTGGAQAVIDALLAVLGPHGTLLMPYFFRLYEGPYDYHHPPPSYTGVIAQQLRWQAGAILSVHPSHPVVALGPAAAALTADHHRVSAVGRGSPFDRLARQGGRVLLLGVTQAANTMLHTAEAHAGVGYWGQPRPDRPTRRWSRLPDGREEWIPLPETPGDSHAFPRIEPWLQARGLIACGTIGRARCRLMPGLLLIEAVVEWLRRDPAGLLCERTDCSFCPWARQFLPVSAGVNPDQARRE